MRTASPLPDHPTLPLATAKRLEAEAWERQATQLFARSEDLREWSGECRERARLLRVEADGLDEAEAEREDLYRVKRLAGGPVTIRRESG